MSSTITGVLIYSGPDRTNLAAAAPALPASSYVDWKALKTAIEAANGYAIELGERAETPFRLDLSMAGIGNVNGTIDEDLYVVVPTSFDDKSGLLIEKIADLQWLIDQAVALPGVGARATHKRAATVQLTDSGIANTRSGVTVRKQDGVAQGMASVTVFDAGVAVGFVRMVAPPLANITAAAGLHRRWK